MKDKTTLGIATIALAVIAIIIVAAIGAAAYFAFFNGGGGGTSATSSTTTPSGATTSSSAAQSTASTPQQTTSTQQSTTAAASTSSGAFDTSGLVKNMANLVGNFSAMTVELSSTGTTTSSNSVTDYSYLVVGHPFVNGTHFTEVNVSTSGPSSSNESVILWFDPQGNVTLAQSGGQNYSGTMATSFAYAFTFFFQLFFNDAASLANAYNSLTYQGTSTQTFGNTQLSVTTYSWNYANQGTYTISVGNLPGTGIYLITNWTASGNGSSASFKLTSLTKA